MVLTVENLRALFRNLEAFRSVFETEGIDTIRGPDGDEVCLWDLEYLYEQVPKLPERQRQAIEYFLVGNLREEDVAEIMGISRTNPVGLCATNGLKNLMKMAKNGEFERSFVVGPI